VSQLLQASDETEIEIESLDSMSALRMEVDEGFELALQEMKDLESQLENLGGDNLLALCKDNVVNTVVGQFGLASLLIDSRDGGAVTTTHNFEQGLTANAGDAEKYQRMDQSRSMSGAEWQDLRKQKGYDRDFPRRRKEGFQKNEILRDEYTGRELPKDGRTHLDHVVSAREIDTDAGMNLHLSADERVRLALNDDNLAFTSESINASKNDHKMEDWLDKTNRQGEANHERYGIDRDKAEKRDQRARKTINREVNTAALKKYTGELMATGAKDAANMAYYTALGVIMKELAEGSVKAVKKAFSARHQGFREILNIFKAEMHEVVVRLKKRWKEIAAGSIEAGITAFLSNIVVFLINMFATTLKKVVKMIRAGFVSLVQALKLLASPPPGMSRGDAGFEALKILTAGVIGALSLGLSASIEKLLQAIPGLQPLMMFPVVSGDGEPTTVSDILAVTLSGIVGGLLSTIAIYLLDQLRNGALANKLDIQLISQSGLLVEYSSARSWLTLHDAYGQFETDARELWRESQQARSSIDQGTQQMQDARHKRNSAMEKLRQRRQQR